MQDRENATPRKEWHRIAGFVPLLLPSPLAFPPLAPEGATNIALRDSLETALQKLGSPDTLWSR